MKADILQRFFGYLRTRMQSFAHQSSMWRVPSERRGRRGSRVRGSRISSEQGDTTPSNAEGNVMGKGSACQVSFVSQA